jgi:hypothetical protein
MDLAELRQDFPVRSKGRSFTFSLAVLLLAVLAGCVSQPRSTYPVLAQTVESDADMDCTGFDDELLKANAIRDAILEEHGVVIGAAYLGTAVDVATEPISGVLLGMIRGLSTSKARKKYIEAAAAAGLRMEQMLVYKEQKNCPSGPTGDPSLSDSITLIKLQDLESQLRQESITQRQYISERRMLLDDLR